MKVTAMATSLLIGLCLLILSQGATGLAQSSCSVQGPPNPYGQKGYVGNAGYTFDYWSDAGNVTGDNFLQPGTKNLGPTPLTIDWPEANYFRRGIASGKEAPGTCESDRNPLNTAMGVIRYGPNANFIGPIATFYKRSGVAQSSAARGPIDFIIDWESILDSGEKYPALVAVNTTASGPNSIRYTFTNKGAPVELEWGGVLSGAALAAAQRQNSNLVRAARLVLRGPELVQFTVVGDGQAIASVTSPLSVFIPNGLLLYRDSHRGLAVVSGAR